MVQIHLGPLRRPDRDPRPGQADPYREGQARMSKKLLVAVVAAVGGLVFWKKVAPDLR